MIVGRRHISNITGFEENSDSSDFTCSQLDQFVQNQVNLAFFNQCYLANVMVIWLIYHGMVKELKESIIQ